jgi:hypothetical protein
MIRDQTLVIVGSLQYIISFVCITTLNGLVSCCCLSYQFLQLRVMECGSSGPNDILQLHLRAEKLDKKVH